MGDAKLVDSMLCDGLIDAFHDYHMGITGNKIYSILGIRQVCVNSK